MELAEVCELIVDCEHKTAPTQAEGYPSIRTPNIGRGYFILDGVNRVSEETYLAWSRRATPQPGDLIMAREAPVGNVAMIPHGMKPCLGQRTLLIRPKKEEVDPAYLTYLLLGDEVQGVIHSKTNGATVAHLNMKDVRSLPLPELPDLPTQRRIAGILSAYDELIANNQRRIAVLEQMARALYREWFVYFRFPAEASAKAGAPGVRIQPGSELPEGWEVKALPELAEVTYGSPFDSKQFNTTGEGTPLIRIRDISNGVSATWTTQEASEKYHVSDGEILVGMDGDFHMCLWSSGHAYQNQRIAKFTSRGAIGNYHLFLALEKPIQELNRAIVGTTVAHLGAMHIKEIKVIMPTTDVLERAKAILEPIAEQQLILKKQTANLRRTRDLLLPRLMSGRVEVGTQTEKQTA